MKAESKSIHGSEWLFVCSGSLETSNDLDFLEEGLKAGKSVVLQMAAVNYVNSCGFGALVEESENFKSLGLTLKIKSLPVQVRKTFKILGAEALLLMVE